MNIDEVIKEINDLSAEIQYVGIDSIKDDYSAQQALHILKQRIEPLPAHKVRRCAFQYWDGRKIVEDKDQLTLDEAKELWNKHYTDMVKKVEEGEDIEVVIWVNMKHPSDYQETLIHLYAPEVRNGSLYEPKYYGATI